jgi:hypothetical protein
MHDDSKALVTALAYVLDHPGETSKAVNDWLSKVQAYAAQHPEQRADVRKNLVKELQARTTRFPQRGVVSRASNGRWYLQICDERHYVGTVSRILDALEHGFNPQAFDPGRFAASASQMGIYPPPCPWGTHVSLGRTVLADRNGEEVAFALDNLGDFPDHRMGMRPSGFDPNLFPVWWYVLYVTIPGFHELAPEYRYRPHIAVGVLAARRYGGNAQRRIQDV